MPGLFSLLPDDARAPSDGIGNDHGTRGNVSDFKACFARGQLIVTQFIPTKSCFGPIEFDRYAFAV